MAARPSKMKEDSSETLDRRGTSKVSPRLCDRHCCGRCRWTRACETCDVYGTCRLRRQPRCADHSAKLSIEKSVARLGRQLKDHGLGFDSQLESARPDPELWNRCRSRAGWKMVLG